MDEQSGEKGNVAREVLAPGSQILKGRDDHKPVLLESVDTEDGAGGMFNVAPQSSCSWARPGDQLRPTELRERVEPWLTALCQSEHLSILLGSGLTYAAHSLAAGVLSPVMTSGSVDDSEFADLIKKEAARVASVAGRRAGNVEDQIRAASDLLRGMEILAADDEEMANGAKRLRDNLERLLKSLAGSILEAERGIACASEERRERAFSYVVTFLMSFASRSGTRDRLNVFTTNYDRVIEAAADAAGLHLLDRFVGALAPVFRSTRLDLDLHYNPPGVRGEPRYVEGVARFTKLHGSVDWIETTTGIRRVGIPFGATDIQTFLNAPGLADGDSRQLMIYPNAAKDRETSGYPYVDLFRDFAAACCRPNHTLFTYGYSFGDDHLNRVIEDMLTIPSTHLVVMSYSDEPLGRIMKTYERIARPAQVSLLIGDRLGDLVHLVDWYLPKPAIDRTTFRMAELLKQRMGASGDRKPPVELGASGGADA